MIDTQMPWIVIGPHGDTGKQLFSYCRTKHIECQTFDEWKHNPRPARIIHLAARHPHHSDEEIFNSNILYLKEVSEHAARHECDFVFLSSTSVYGNRESGHFSENSPVSPYDLYTSSKIFGETWLETLGIPAIALRVPALLGFRNQTNFFSQLFNKLHAHERITLTNYSRPFNNYLPTVDLLRFLEQLPALQGFTLLNLAPDADHSLFELVNIMKGELHSRSTILAEDRDVPLRVIKSSLINPAFGL